jgi:xylulokinase
LRRNEPEVWEKPEKFFMVNGFISWRLTGEYILDHHSASQCDPLYDVHENRWIEEWTEEVAPGLPTPRLLWPAEVVGEVTQMASEETGIPAGTPVPAGTIDARSEGASVGVQNSGDLMLMYGTIMFIIEVLERTLHPPGLWGTTGILPSTHNLAAGMATSGALPGWLQKISGSVPYADLTEEAAAVPPGSDALVVLPYFAGERTPLFDPQARGVISGLTISHTRGHLYRAMLEATAYGVRHTFESMREAGGGGVRLVAVGGGTKGGLWTQIVSDVTGRPHDLPEQTIGAAYGDALLAARASGLAEPDADWGRIVDTVEPDEANREIYDELYGVYRQLYPATRGHRCTGSRDRRKGEGMSSREIERPRYEHRVVSWLRRHLLGDQTDAFHHGKESGSKMPGRRGSWSSRSGTPTVPNACSAVASTRWATGAVAATRPLPRCAGGLGRDRGDQTPRGYLGLRLGRAQEVQPREHDVDLRG